MLIRREIDCLLNIVLPVVAGTLIYFTKTTNGVLRDHLPDGLWAYALTYCLMIIWDKHLPFLWIMILQVLFMLFEFAQLRGLVEGTGDYRDMIVYVLFSGAALLTGTRFFINKQNNLYAKDA